MHINRTRFWVPEGREHVEFLLRWVMHVNAWIGKLTMRWVANATASRYALV